MRVEFVSATLCEDLIEDTSGGVSYIRCIQKGYVASTPSTLPPAHLSIMWSLLDVETNNIDVELKLHIISPQNKKKQILHHTFSLEKQNEEKHIMPQFNIRLTGVPVDEVGMNFIAISAKYNSKKFKTYTKLPLMIEKRDPEELQTD